jgi:putative phosphoesterase
VRLLILSDTHLPRRAKDLPSELWAAIDDADLVVHAGDWVTVELLDALSARAEVLGCWGNNDGADLRERLPEVAARTIEGVRVRVVHETGDAKGREARMDRAHPDTDLLVFGHSHIPWDTTTPGGMRLLNPGSPTDRRRQPVGTYLTLSLAQESVFDVQLHPIRGD